MVRKSKSSKKSRLQVMPKRLLQFFDKNFDWLVVLFITLIFLSIFVIF